MFRSTKSLVALVVVIGCAAAAFHFLSAKKTPPPVVAAYHDSPAQTPTPALSATDSDAAMLQFVRSLALNAPEKALAWAQTQSDPTQARLLIAAALRVWGEKDSQAAVQWVLGQDTTLRERELLEVFTGADHQPEILGPILTKLIAENPDAGNASAAIAIRAFCADGQFNGALTLLQFLAPGGNPDWTAVLFRDWAHSHPADAMEAALSGTNPPLATAALQAAAATWSADDPAGLAAYAVTMPGGEAHDYTLNQALNTWVTQNPAAMSTWLNTLSPGPDFDTGAALVLSRTDIAARDINSATKWVEGISDATVKQEALLRVLAQWVQSDPGAAQQYVSGATWLDDHQREAILQNFPATPAAGSSPAAAASPSQ